MKTTSYVSRTALIVALLGAATSLSAQTAPESPREAGPAPQAEDGAPDIVVLGTRRLDRSVTDSASPVDVISATELVSQPAADMLDVG